MGDFAFSDENGLWVRFSTYKNNGESLPDITLIPTTHAGNSSFYREVKDESFCNDIVLFESVYVPFKKALKWLYHIIAFKTKLTLEAGSKKEVVDFGVFHQELPDGPRVREFSYKPPGLPKRKIRQVIADADKHQFLQSMHKIPLRAKIAFPFFLISILVMAPFIVSRELLISFGHKEGCDCKHCKGNANQDRFLKSQAHKWDAFGWCFDQYKTYILHDRDEILKKILIKEVCKQEHKSNLIAVQYGADHMGKLELVLKGLGYSLTSSRRVLAVSKRKKHNISNEEAGYNVAWAKFENLPSNIAAESDLSMRDSFYTNTQTCVNYKSVA